MDERVVVLNRENMSTILDKLDGSEGAVERVLEEHGEEPSVEAKKAIEEAVKMEQAALIYEKILMLEERVKKMKEGTPAHLKMIDQIEELVQKHNALCEPEKPVVEPVVETDYVNTDSPEQKVKQGTVVMQSFPLYLPKEGKMVDSMIRMSVLLVYGAEILGTFEADVTKEPGPMKISAFTPNQMKGFIGTALVKIDFPFGIAFRVKVGRARIRESKIRQLVPSQPWDWRMFNWADGKNRHPLLEFAAYSMHREMELNVQIEPCKVQGTYVLYAGQKWMQIEQAEKLWKEQQAKVKAKAE